MRSAALLLTLAAFTLYAAQALQNDWSGGPSAAMAQGDWGSLFLESDNVAWMSIPGQLQLSSSPITPAIEHEIATGIDKPYSSCLADLNGDGWNDVIVGSSTNDGIFLYLGSENGDWNEQIVSSEIPSVPGLDVEDFDGDGLLDIAATGGTEVVVFYNGGGSVPSWESSVAGSGYLALHDVDAVDMDQDGDQDIVAADYDGDRLFWLRNEGGAVPDWTDLVIDTVIDYPCKPHAEDINGDGHMDVVCSAWTGGKVHAFYGSGGSEPVWTSQVIDPNCVAAHGTRACDMDGDGDMDVVSASINGSKLYVYWNDGALSPSWSREVLGTIAGTAMVRLGDIDGDGDMDAIASSWGNAGVAWWENTESGTAFIKHIVKSGGQATSWAMAGDADNDGDLDVISVRYQQGGLYWHEVTDFVASGSLTSSILDTGETPQWASMEWVSSVPPGCGLSVQFRSSGDPGDLGEWSSDYYSPSTLSGEVDRYFQYMINLSTSDPLFSPVLTEFSLNWDAQGVGEEEYGVLEYSNPSTGALSIGVSTTLDRPVRVSVFSLSGRLVRQVSASSGDCFSFCSLSPGIYLVAWNDMNGLEGSDSVVLLER